MALQQQLRDDMKQAMKARDSKRLQVIRYLLAEIQKVEIDAGPLSDTQVEAIIKKEVKKRKDSIDQYNKAGREDLVSEEQEQLEVVHGYLPEQMDEASIEAVIAEVMAGGATGFAAVMGATMKQIGDKADGNTVRTLVQKKLNA